MWTECVWFIDVFSAELYESLIRVSWEWFTFFPLHREHLDLYFLGLSLPTGRPLTGLGRDRGDSSAAWGNSGSTWMTATWWERQWGVEISRIVTRLSASTFPAVMEERVSGTRSPFTQSIRWNVTIINIFHYHNILVTLKTNQGSVYRVDLHVGVISPCSI